MNCTSDSGADKEDPDQEPGDLLEIDVLMDNGDEASNPEAFVEESLQTPNDDHVPSPTSQEQILKEIKEVGMRLDNLASHFEGKIKYDEHKNQIIDSLHNQLQDFRDGIIKKHLLSMITDVIKIIDDIRKFKSHYENTAQSEYTAEMLLEFMDQITSDLEDLFTFQGISPYTCPGETFDSSRQRVIKRVATDKPDKNRLLAESLRPGYEWEGKVIRPEMVSVYEYNDEPHNKADES
jgi:molecular chaperone GrpE (heat shock protein)